MNWVEGFTYIFGDKNWVKKMLVGSLVTSVPVVESLSNGYQMQVIENLKAGNPQPLPEWNNLEKMFGKGFKLWLAVNLFYIPSMIISFISWFIGIPFLLGTILSFIASAATEDFIQKQGLSLFLGYLIQIIVSGLAVIIGSILLPAVFFFVPAMALRCQETGSLLSTLNIFAHVKFVLQNLGDYVVSRVLIAGMLIGMHLVASAIGGATVWILGIGVLLAWVIGAAARFWSRLAWAYFLADMRMKKQNPNVGSFQIEQNYQNPPIERQYAPAFSLTEPKDKYHYWGNY